MENCCDIYDVTMAAWSIKTETGGLHYEQKIYKRIFQIKIEKFKKLLETSSPFDLIQSIETCLNAFTALSGLVRQGGYPIPKKGKRPKKNGKG